MSRTRRPRTTGKRPPAGAGLATQILEDPSRVLRSPPAEALELLDTAERQLARLREPALVRVAATRPVRVIADTHGDYVSARHALEDARAGPTPSPFVALGDYIDRATKREPRPAALPGGSLANLCYLLAAKLLAPREVILLQGNHESARRLPVVGPSYLSELRQFFDRDSARAVWERSFAVVERFPLAAVTANGVFLAHGGIAPPSAPPPGRWRRDDLGLLEGLLWSDPAVGYEDRGAGFPFGEADLERFLASVGASVLVRGHDPKHLGAALYGGRVLTLQTSDIFGRLGHGGILMAEIPAIPRVAHVAEIEVRELKDGAWVPYAVHGLRGAGAGPGGEVGSAVLRERSAPDG